MKRSTTAVAVGLTLTLGLTMAFGQRRAKAAGSSIDIQAYLPPPSWIMTNAEDLGFQASELRALKGDLQESRRRVRSLRTSMDAHRKALRGALRAPAFDRSAIESHFESLMTVEAEIKREAMRARLDFAASITSEQRERIRTSSAAAADQTRTLRWRIEEIRRRGKERAAAGQDTSLIRGRVRRIERLIRLGDLAGAVERTDLLLESLER